MEDPLLEQWSEFMRSPESKKLVRWLRCKAYSRLSGRPCNERMEIATPPYFGRLGIFVTLRKGAKVRGCYGAFSHAITDIESLLSDYLDGALTRDPRYDPLDISEFAATDIIVTVTAPPYAVADFSSIDTRRYGIMLVCGGGETRIFVPAEIKAISYVERYATGGSCQASVFRAVTIR
ncbi:MAG: hypothetical protein A2176_02400 [Spirochaetes bacterium RBG_13_51_14]|nr:MAG: hypothetical protein A2176_02400 [Spirochaetes bacterium RBG_13_51_14]